MTSHDRPVSSRYIRLFRFYKIGYLLIVISIPLIILTGGAALPVLLLLAGLLLSAFKIALVPMNHYYVLKLAGNFRGFLRGGGGRPYPLFRLYEVDGPMPYWVNHQIVIDLKDVEQNRTPGDYSYKLEGQLVLHHDPTRIQKRDDQINLIDESSLEAVLEHNARLLIHKDIQKYLNALMAESEIEDRQTRNEISRRIKDLFTNKGNSYGLMYHQHSNVSMYADVIDEKRQVGMGNTFKPRVAFEQLHSYLQAYGIDLDELRRYGSAHQPVYQQERAYEISRGQPKHKRKEAEAASQREAENQAIVRLMQKLHLDKEERSGDDYARAVHIALRLLDNQLWDGQQQLYLTGLYEIEAWLNDRTDEELQQLHLTDIPGIRDNDTRHTQASSRLTGESDYLSLGDALLDNVRKNKLT